MPPHSPNTLGRRESIPAALARQLAWIKRPTGPAALAGLADPMTRSPTHEKGLGHQPLALGIDCLQDEAKEDSFKHQPRADSLD